MRTTVLTITWKHDDPSAVENLSRRIAADLSKRPWVDSVRMQIVADPSGPAAEPEPEPEAEPGPPPDAERPAPLGHISNTIGICGVCGAHVYCTQPPKAHPDFPRPVAAHHRPADPEHAYGLSPTNYCRGSNKAAREIISAELPA